MRLFFNWKGEGIFLRVGEHSGPIIKGKYPGYPGVGLRKKDRRTFLSERHRGGAGTSITVPGRRSFAQGARKLLSSMRA